MSLKLTIATRESRLALWQANHVKDLLESLGHQVTLLGMTTMGDQILDKPLSKVGGKGLFIKELETALADGSADLAVHSLKDVPMELPEGFSLACILTREDPRDSWVSNEYPTLQSLPHGAVVGTSSLRRTVLINALRPDLVIEPYPCRGRSKTTWFIQQNPQHLRSRSNAARRRSRGNWRRDQLKKGRGCKSPQES